LLPRLAAFAPERFAQDYLHKCVAHLLALLKHAGERGSAFAALADMAGSLAAVGCQDGFEPYLPAIAAQVGGGKQGEEGIVGGGGVFSFEHTLFVMMCHCHVRQWGVLAASVMK
jgi:hypothetical protein